MLAPGTRFGPHAIESSLGAGGMGEVYRARDTTLHRLVAIKVLPDSFARDPERIARFEREARTRASLNDPNIAAIFGFHNEGATRWSWSSSTGRRSSIADGRIVAVEPVETQDVAVVVAQHWDAALTRAAR